MAQERRNRGRPSPPRGPAAGQARADQAPRPPGPVPDAALLKEAAVNHLARFAATEAGLRRVLQRRVDRWVREAEAFGMEDIAAQRAAARAAVAEVAREMAASGTVDDAAFAESRARRLLRTGSSRRAALAHLAQKGVDSETAAAAVPDSAEAELDAALAFCRRRRTGPFARDEATPEARRKAMGALARAGFGRDVALRALDLPPAEAEDRLLAARQG